MSKLISIVEDEPLIRENYADALHKQGYKVEILGGKEEALARFNSHLPDLVLLDIGLDDDSEAGFDICRGLRSKSATLPIIFLTARDSDLDVVSGLRLGADDYLTKDISLANLCARITAFFRRLDAIKSPDTEESLLQRGALTLDMDRLTTYWNEKPVDLTLTEFWLVHSLARRPGHVKNRDQLMQDAKIVVDDATITSHIKRLRNKFLSIDSEFKSIDTVYASLERAINNTL